MLLKAHSPTNIVFRKPNLSPQDNPSQMGDKFYL